MFKEIVIAFLENGAGISINSLVLESWFAPNCGIV